MRFFANEKWLAISGAVSPMAFTILLVLGRLSENRHLFLRSQLMGVVEWGLIALAVLAGAYALTAIALLLKKSGVGLAAILLGLVGGAIPLSVLLLAAISGFVFSA